MPPPAVPPRSNAAVGAPARHQRSRRRSLSCSSASGAWGRHSSAAGWCASQIAPRWPPPNARPPSRPRGDASTSTSRSRKARRHTHAPLPPPPRHPGACVPSDRVLAVGGRRAYASSCSTRPAAPSSPRFSRHSSASARTTHKNPRPCNETHRPRRPHARHCRRCAAVVLVFDTGSAESFAKLQRYWLAQVQRQRLYLIRQPPGSTVVLAHVVDEVWPPPPPHTHKPRGAPLTPGGSLSRVAARARGDAARRLLLVRGECSPLLRDARQGQLGVAAYACAPRTCLPRDTDREGAGARLLGWPRRQTIAPVGRAGMHAVQTQSGTPSDARVTRRCSRSADRSRHSASTRRPARREPCQPRVQ